MAEQMPVDLVREYAWVIWVLLGSFYATIAFSIYGVWLGRCTDQQIDSDWGAAFVIGGLAVSLFWPLAGVSWLWFHVTRHIIRQIEARRKLLTQYKGKSND